MTKILFICHGNICRSPMAEFVMKDLIKKAGLEAEFQIDSAATSAEELGNPIYPPVQQLLRQHQIPFCAHRARQITPQDADRYSYLVGMDHWNLQAMRRVFKNSPALSLLLDWTDHPRDVADPWYTGQFSATWQDITQGCQALLTALRQRHSL